MIKLLLCALCHDWSTWKVVLRKRLAVVQERQCARCRKVQWRQVRARIGAEREAK